jgi:tRNA(fMet)-specific endonuclease VapC
VANSQKKKQNSAALTDFLNYAVLLDWPYEAAPLYGQIRTGIQKRGTPIGAMDLLIATHALFLDTVLVTNNTREFERVPGLKIENWETMGDR